MSDDDRELTELQKKQLDELAERIKALDADRQKLLMDRLDSQRLYTVPEVARLFSVDEETVRRWIRADRMSATNIGAGYRIPRSEVERFWEMRGGDVDELWGGG